MTAITIDIPEEELQAIEEFAKKTSRATADVVREAIADFRKKRISTKRPISVLEIPSHSVGKILRPLSPDDDILGEMLSDDP